MRWPDKTPKSANNAFDWKGKPSSFSIRGLTERQLRDGATRENNEGTLGAHSKPITSHPQRSKNAD